MYRPTANELKIMLALKEVEEAGPMRVSSKIGMGSSMADYLCRYLTTHGFLQKSGRKTYKLTPVGQKALEEAFTRTLTILRQKEGDVAETPAKIRLP